MSKLPTQTERPGVKFYAALRWMARVSVGGIQKPRMGRNIFRKPAIFFGVSF
jgi:hypothetical protein